MATERQLEILNYIVEIYVKTGDPVSSGVLLDNNQSLNLSSATVRNEMVKLEESGYISKLDASSSRTSGRIPTKKGYEYYLKHIKTNPNSILSIKKKLDKVLIDRKDNIENVLSEAMSIINESTNTLTISKNYIIDNKLQDITTYPTKKGEAIVIIVTSNGDVVNKDVALNEIPYKDFEKVINTFSKRLRGTSMVDLNENLSSLKEILEIQVTGMEEKFQEVIKVMFSRIESTNASYSGMNSLISAENLDAQTQIKAIFKMIENNSIWGLIDNNDSIETDTSGITVDMDVIDGVSVVKKTIDLGHKNKQLTIVGAKNQDYEKLFSMLEYLEKMIRGR